MRHVLCAALLMSQPLAARDSESYALAPHPICFSIDGRPSRTMASTRNGDFDVDWDGERLSMEPHRPVNRIWKFIPRRRPPRREPPDNNLDSGCWMGCAVAVLFGVVFWGGVVWLLIWAFS